NSNNSSPVQTLLDEQDQNTCGLPSAESVAAQEVVLVSESGFNPVEVALKVGQTVRWQNIGNQDHRVVVGNHPLHNKCIGLDSKLMQPDQSFGFTFTKPGQWQVHLEENVSYFMTVIVT